ncbi:uncharacterized protein LOC111795871 [Cucurbita pepo subsp. pepo]|uniref:uncharacterized protein LOC111795871 n=1 Tax=Cucurbita pepo subsp. pepo TaxID=3664 RepID=UPI000C9D5591|nr:uncharacterized protein LOC111795871 [Cucurbita pepo subsp. pepo]XP_023534256.1 uncharacterized protein LOC111795871 [Cucurbita pepo subsp. pepo]XP_023534258.1 uncharacterized protein LOC111795871 [Cucurbita pepo subsp. pepo]XP_023534259.1 uncharacterized protein LOC111795871 [Cucurbita pepo subsp. pepo]XP_023534260.1 uncharacterized protein LOC111795871 [Cucurbita pepo subsp. pepo]XP_023534261.1 uncharacterized protein LOC111795871 [Cucurbita pepo subsp. pepo]
MSFLNPPMMEPSQPQNPDDYSAATTIITFQRPIPLLRGPIRAGRSENPSAGPYLLAFRDPQAWKSAYKICESKIIEQCEAGARIGCSITAINKCKRPWWSFLIQSKKGLDLKDREQCEEREMEACLAGAKEKCVGFAKEKCSKPFMEARIVARGRNITEKEAKMWICWASMADKKFSVPSFEIGRKFSGVGLEKTTYRANELLDNYFS